MKFFKGFLSIAIIMLLPLQVLAHGEEVEKAGTGILGYGLVIAILLFVITLGFWIFTNKKVKRVKGNSKEEKQFKEKLKKIVNVYLVLSILSFIIAVIIGFTFLSGKEQTASSSTLTHIHGLGYSADGEELYVPAHDGLRVFHEGHWAIPEGPKHDYMGFTMVDNGFYSSGHPAEGSDMKNPFGVLKSTDMGQTLETLDLYGKIDFHLMTAGYQTHAIYVGNPSSNERMKETGLYYTLDETKTWVKSALKGFNGKLTAIAAHPTDEKIVAVGSDTGLFISEDNGQTITSVLEGSPTTAIQFTSEGNLLAATVTNEENYKIKLVQINSQTKETQELNMPHFQNQDAVSYIAVNPTNNQEIAVATFKKDIFLTTDLGESWTQIAKNGTGSNSEVEGEGTAHGSHHAPAEEGHGHGGDSQEFPLNAVWRFNKQPAENEELTLEIQMMDLDGNKVEDFDIEHEKLMHLIVVRKDLSVFQHLHPEYIGDGLFKINTEFPKGGDYKLIADVVPSGYETTTVTQWIDVEGSNIPEHIIVDESLTKTIDGIKISLQLDDVAINKEQTLLFHVADAATGEPITNLQPYLGTIGHVVIVSKDGEEYLHSHPINGEESGPEAKFVTVFPKEGVYKIWAQFQINGEIVTAPFVIQVQ